MLCAPRFFVGGKVTISGYGDAYLSNQVNVYSAADQARAHIPGHRALDLTHPATVPDPAIAHAHTRLGARAPHLREAKPQRGAHGGWGPHCVSQSHKARQRPTGRPAFC